ncbi:uncharacterized protein PAC_02700 [Phialocephala subalpina]|uniref:Heterokaryon incompatibility domain-containing protein n=1 Tax=Phialocephala subalpina TaxID=576137 RepID=A0A1L7WJ66_9HELO|nr:uncharacterized protein PAC_02700 [Phialocephala subalpina]
MIDFIIRVFRESDHAPFGDPSSYVNNFWFEMEGMLPIEIQDKERTFRPGELMEEGDTIFCDKTYKRRTARHCMDLFEAVKSAVDDAFPALDFVFSNLVGFKLKLDLDEEVVTKRVYDLLARMPELPLSLAKIEPGFCSSDEWNNLSVIKHPSTNTIRLALAIAADGFWGPELPLRPKNSSQLDQLVPTDKNDWDSFSFQDYIAGISQLLEEVTQLQEESVVASDRHHWFIVKSFLWNSFQRGTLLLLWYVRALSLETMCPDSQKSRFILDRQLKWGYTWQASLHLPRIKVAALKTIEQIFEDLDAPLKSKYMCNWAYKSIRETHLTTAIDMQLFHHRFNNLFGNQRGRCLPRGESCCGKSPLACRRFVGANIKNLDQSAHNLSCTGRCRKLYWDEASYRRVTGARAVCLQETDESFLRYRETSEKTLAVSHVWSHGQGGRPERVLNNTKPGGFNSCLHQRYAKIAREFGCNSYWMDTPCIPEDHQLRKESIAKINTVFTESCITLICDRDIMLIDVSKLQSLPETQWSRSPAIIEICESIIATLLVCDWNIRSWTFLESMRGRQHIYILFTNDAVLRLKTIIDLVCNHGRIEIAVLFLASQHMLPSIKHEQKFLYPFGAFEEQASLGYIGKESAAALLSRRHASRPGDDIVIWSLLTSDKPYYDAETWWKASGNSFLGRPTRMGFLISSVPRIRNVEGLSWAPRQPGIHLLPSELRKTIYQPQEDQRTVRAFIMGKDLKGVWGVHKFSVIPQAASEKTASLLRRKFLTTRKASRTKFVLLTAKASKKQGFRHVSTLILNHLIPGGLAQHRDLRVYLAGFGYMQGILVQPLESRGSNVKETASKFRGCDGYLFGVCGSHDGEKWQWVGVFEWELGETLPEFNVEEVCIS